MLKNEVKEALEKYKDRRFVYVMMTNGVERRLETKHVNMNYSESSMICQYSVYEFDRIVSISETPRVYRLDEVTVSLGSDPEFFFVNDSDDVVPSSEIVDGTYSDVVCDGFQGELNPSSDTCRQVAGSRIARGLLRARRMAREMGKDISLSVGKIISDDVWKNTPSSVKRFGCNPTVSAYDESKKKSSGLRERFRSCGGHIHLGHELLRDLNDEELKRLVYMLDIVAGNTAVLVDRDPLNKLRRKNYGRAGEYRVKSYGIEYRTLSNFWLRHYILWSFSSGLCRAAVNLYFQNADKELFPLFKQKNIQKAINDNDYNLAYENWLILKKWLQGSRVMGGSLDTDYLESIDVWFRSEEPLHFCDTLEKTMSNWEKKLDNHDIPGFEYFIETGEHSGSTYY